MTVIKPEMISDKITRHDILPMSFLKKSAYTGSKRRLRYRMERTELPTDNDENDEKKAAEEKASVPDIVLRAWTWSTGLSFDNTPREDFHIKDFEFSDAGIDECLKFLNEELSELET